MRSVAIPPLLPVRQRLTTKEVPDPAVALRKALGQPRISSLIKPGQRVAVLAGSRGIDRIGLMLGEIVAWLRERGARPFILAAMGSHGGGDASGRLEVLARLGITERTMGIPLRAGGRTVVVDEVGGVPVHVAAEALKADAVIVMNRVKAHTSFHGKYESGLVKMLAVGLGHERSASVVHAGGARALADRVPELARSVLGKVPVLIGVALVENGVDRLHRIEVMEASRIMAREPALLALSRRAAPRLPFGEADVLVVDRFGKDLSGTGLDTNVIGRLMINGEPEPKSPRLRRIVALRLSAGAAGNAYGIGLADVTTRRVVEAMDPLKTRLNVMASTFIERARVPISFDSDRQAIRAAIATCGVTDPRALKLARVPDTLHLEEVLVSPALAERLTDEVEAQSRPRPWRFDSKGDLNIGPAFGPPKPSTRRKNFP